MRGLLEKRKRMTTIGRGSSLAAVQRRDGKRTFVSLHWLVVVVAVVVEMLLFTFSGDGVAVVEGREAPAGLLVVTGRP